MAKSTPKKKSAKEASETFHNIMKASMSNIDLSNRKKKKQPVKKAAPKK